MQIFSGTASHNSGKMPSGNACACVNRTDWFYDEYVKIGPCPAERSSILVASFLAYRCDERRKTLWIQVFSERIVNVLEHYFQAIMHIEARPRVRAAPKPGSQGLCHGLLHLPETRPSAHRAVSSNHRSRRRCGLQRDSNRLSRIRQFEVELLVAIVEWCAQSEDRVQLASVGVGSQLREVRLRHARGFRPLPRRPTARDEKHKREIHTAVCVTVNPSGPGMKCQPAR